MFICSTKVCQFLLFVFTGLQLLPVILVKKKIEDGSTVSSSQVLSRINRAFHLKRPRCKSLLPSWSLPAVLQVLSKEPFEPMYKASLHHLTL